MYVVFVYPVTVLDIVKLARFEACCPKRWRFHLSSADVQVIGCPSSSSDTSSMRAILLVAWPIACPCHGLSGPPEIGIVFAMAHRHLLTNHQRMKFR